MLVLLRLTFQKQFEVRLFKLLKESCSQDNITSPDRFWISVKMIIETFADIEKFKMVRIIPKFLF